MKAFGVCVAALVAAVVVLGFGVSSAGAVEPWWHVSVTSRPTHLWVASAPEVQEVSVGLLTPLEVEGKFVACVGVFGEAFCEPLVGHPYTPSGAALEVELEAAYGLSGVEVMVPSEGVYEVKTPGHFVPALVVGPPPPPLEASAEGTVSVQGGSSGRLAVIVSDVGDAPAEGGLHPVTVTDELPGEVVAIKAEEPVGAEKNLGAGTCAVGSPHVVSCTFSQELPAYEAIEMEVVVAVSSSSPPVGTENGTVSVVGGGAKPVSVAQPLQINPAATQFGVESYSFTAEEEGGGRDTQAGSHPFQLTTVVNLNQGPVSGPDQREMVEQQPGLARNFRFKLPSGLVGNPTALTQCTEKHFNTISPATLTNECQSAAAIGVATVTLIEETSIGLTTFAVPVFNLPPAEGEPARFGFTVAGIPVVLDTAVRSGEGYGVTVDVKDTSQLAQLLNSTVTLWGVPGDARHDAARGYGCVYFKRREIGNGECERPGGLETNAFLRMPTSCGTALEAPMELERWNVPLGSQIVEEKTEVGSLDGCNRVPFEPQLEVAPGTSSAATPTGVTVHVKVPQEASTPGEGIAESDVRNTTVALPAGLEVNPSAAAGLAGCTEKEIGFVKKNGVTGELVFEEETQAERNGEAPHKTGCVEASQIGTVKIETPVLKEPLQGAVYQAAQEANPFGSLLALYLVAEAPKAGVRVRLAGEVRVQPDGQLVSTFPATPQVPFEAFTLKFFGGGKAALATTVCGAYSTTSAIEPWSSTSTTPFTASPSTFFDVTSGPGGKPCSSLGGFAPTFLEGTTSNAGGAFSPLTLTIARNDGEQMLSTVSETLPPGLAGMLSKVQLCPEAQANAGDCPAASKIGHVRVSAGVGSEPVSLPEAGRPEDPVYLTGPYKGAPFGLSIVATAEAGPFNLDENNHPVVVRGKITVNPKTAQVSIQSEPMPQRLQNIALDVRGIEVVVDKPGFIFNPTNCQPMSITGAIGSAEGATAAVNSRFEAADCASLPFKPTFKVSSHKAHTRRFGAYLHVKVTSSAGQANIKSVFVELPKILPSRTETLKLACSEKQFAANPAGCPAGSHVGTAIARTPVLPVPLTGPVIFVSHGGAAFPDLDIVLQGDGVTVDLTGNTNIVKGITSSTFKSVPDVPINSFELTLSQGPHSALAATANLCTQTITKRVKTKTHGKTSYHKKRITQKRKLVMPTTITAQNNAQTKQNTLINVQGCHKTKKAKAKAKAKKG